SSESVYCDYGSDRDLRPGDDGTNGKDGYRNNPGQGGAPLQLPVNYCSVFAGASGPGGDGAGNSGGEGPYQSLPRTARTGRTAV
ncbi:hypothetical protein OV450_6071, partial [Actinobacteria bacterium OV450]